MDLIENLVFAHHAMVASENLLCVAAERSQEPRLTEYFRTHLQEEAGHSQWLAEDLCSVGVDVRRTLLPLEVLQMVGSVYYLIYHVDPCALLGYMRVLEGPRQLDWAHLEKTYPASLLRTLRYHDEHDPEHLVQIRVQIDRCTAQQRALIGQTIRETEQYIHRATTRSRAA